MLARLQKQNVHKVEKLVLGTLRADVEAVEPTFVSQSPKIPADILLYMRKDQVFTIIIKLPTFSLTNHNVKWRFWN